MDQKVWGRFPCDTERSYGVFCEWLHTTDRPSLSEWCLGFPRDGVAWPTPAIVRGWADCCSWAARAEAFDVWTDQHLHRKYLPVVWRDLAAIQKTLRHEWAKHDAVSQVSETPYLTPKDCLQAIRLLSQSEIAMARLSSKEKRAKDEGLVLANFSNLTLEEMRTWDRLFAKLTEA